MTRRRLSVIGGLSVASTVVVLAGSAHSPRLDATVQAALRHRQPVVVSAPLPASAAAPATPAAADVSPAPAAPVEPAAASAPVAPAPAPVVTQPSSPAATTTQPKSTAPKTTKPAAAKPSKVGHVFVIALTGTDAATTFSATSPAAYLNGDLRPRGVLLAGFRPLDGADLPNYLAMAGGQPPNEATEKECATFAEFGSDAAPGKDGTVAGDGCAYPNTVLTIGDQLTSSRRSWRAYAEDMGNGPAGAPACRHPESGGPDDTLTGRPGDEYATRHNPFVYFHSLLDLGDCTSDDVALDKLPADLKKTKTTPNLAFIAPNLCHDGTDATCADGTPGGLPAADAFLKQWVPQILASPAYKHDGLLLVVFPSAAPTAPSAAATSPATGALVISRFAKPGATVDKPYDPYSVLRSLEDLYGLEPLAKAKDAKSFAKAVAPSAFAKR